MKYFEVFLTVSALSCAFGGILLVLADLAYKGHPAIAMVGFCFLLGGVIATAEMYADSIIGKRQ